ncbi:hypothetical protein TuanDB_45320, partial [Bacillus anthracis]
SMMINTVQLL